MSDIVRKRKVTILFTQASQRENLETTARTWGELQREIQGKVSDKNCVVRETKNTLQSTEAVLPEGDFVIFAYPQESKAGAKKAAKKVAKKTAKKAAKKTAKKAAKKTAKKASKPASKGVSKAKSEKISKTVGAVASNATAAEATASRPEPQASAKTVSQAVDTMEDLQAEARKLQNTLPGRR